MTRTATASLPRRILAAGVGALTLAAVGVAAARTQPRPGAVLGFTAAHRARVTGATLVCPDIRQLPNALTTFVVVGTGLPGPGQVTMTPAGDPGAVPDRLLGAGQLAGSYRGPVTGPVVLSANGALAASLVAEQLSLSNVGINRGWADVRCSPPQAQQWFLGAATAQGDTPVLTLVNPDPVPALVNVTVLTPAGPANAPAGQGIAVAPDAAVHLPLASLAPGAVATAVEVSTVAGETAAAVRDVRVSGLTTLGTDWVPEQAAPATTVVVAGIPGVIAGLPAARVLVLADPGAENATVTITTTTTAGTFVPSGLSSVTIPAGSVRRIDLSGPVGRSPATVTVRSAGSGPAVPVLAGALASVRSPVTGLSEFAYLGAGTPLAGPALEPANPVTSREDSVLELSAPQGAATVTVSRPAVGSTPAFSLPVAIPAGRAVEVSLRHYGWLGEAATVTPEPGSGPVYAARIIEDQGLFGPLVTAIGLVGAPPELVVPAAVPGPVPGG